ncbi:MAG: division/cell wall cluster transcriptional repressor MraZ [Gammaproteobacteria bacterium]|nr:division/cell wall cluster transcriptional repressor MraZ [Gammaproteobacteria bacterium]MDO9319986.1 division/cell wall cluster transcriptional repressor MraZ [Gammaproteobacteria bacterium]
MFRGVNTISLDSKGRLAMPSRYRDQLVSEFAGRLVATIDPMAKCLLLYPIDVWEEIQKKIEGLSSFNPDTRRFQRMMIGYATDLELDGSGRVLLPQVLRAHAELDKQVALVGQGKKLELWSEANWDEQRTLWMSQQTVGGELPAELQSLSL